MDEEVGVRREEGSSEVLRMWCLKTTQAYIGAPCLDLAETDLPGSTEHLVSSIRVSRLTRQGVIERDADRDRREVRRAAAATPAGLSRARRFPIVPR